MASVYPDEGKLLDLEAIRGANIFTVRLFTDDIVPDHATEFADLTEPTFDGYAPVTIDFAPPELNALNNAQMTSLDNALFQVASTGGSDEVFLWGLCSEHESVNYLHHVERMVAPMASGIPMSTVGERIFITPRKLQGECPLEE